MIVLRTLEILFNDCFEMVKTLPNACFENSLKILKPLKIPKKIKIPPPTKILCVFVNHCPKKGRMGGIFFRNGIWSFYWRMSIPKIAMSFSGKRKIRSPFCHGLSTVLPQLLSRILSAWQSPNLKLHPTIAQGEFSSD